DGARSERRMDQLEAAVADLELPAHEGRPALLLRQAVEHRAVELGERRDLRRDRDGAAIREDAVGRARGLLREIEPVAVAQDARGGLEPRAAGKGLQGAGDLLE